MRSHRRLFAAAAINVSGLALASVIACGSERSAPETGGIFGADAQVPQCRAQCSLDGRSQVTVCGDEVRETKPCAPDQACGAGACQDPCAASAADRSSNGCSFYLQAPRYSLMYKQSCYAAFVVNTAAQDVEISLEYQGKSVDISKSLFRTAPGSATLTPHAGPLAPNDAAILFVSDRDRRGEPWEQSTPFNPDIPCPDNVVPASHVDGLPNGTGFGASFHLQSTVPVSVASIYPFGGAASFLPAATLHLPVSAWAKEHFLIDGWARSQLGDPGVLIVASEDDTDLTILPKVDLQNGAGVRGGPAGYPLSFKLSKGQNLQFVQASELTGSTVTANKPISTYGGHSVANIPTEVSAADYITQQIPAPEQWGSEYVGVGYRPRLGNEHEPVPYRIVAAKDGTILDYDPAIPAGAPTSLSAGQSATFYAGTGDAFVVRTQDSEHPIYVGMYMTGGDTYAGSGDPDFVNVTPARQYLSSYAFYADPTFPETSLVVVRAKSGGRFHDVWLECAGTLNGFRPIGTRGEYEFMRVDLSRNYHAGDRFGDGVCQVGMQRMRSEGPFGATLWGWGSYASYAYSSGTALRKLVDNPITTR